MTPGAFQYSGLLDIFRVTPSTTADSPRKTPEGDELSLESVPNADSSTIQCPLRCFTGQ